MVQLPYAFKLVHLHERIINDVFTMLLVYGEDINHLDKIHMSFRDIMLHIHVVKSLSLERRSLAKSLSI